MQAKRFLSNKSERTFLNVLDTAIELFQTKGFEQTSMRDISRESGLALGAIYYYCQSKEELVFLFYARIAEQIDASFLKREVPSNSLADAYTDYLRLKMSKLGKYRRLLIVVLKESVDRDCPLSPLHDATSDFRIKSIKIFEEMVAKSAPNDSNPSRTARLLWFLHLGILAFWLYDRSEKYAATEKLLAAIASFLKWGNLLRRLPGFQEISNELTDSILGIIH